ncbi:hypothetical protein ACTZWW_13145 [Salinarimonas sp. NSM]|uniref:hypothetical protein n=1 Tax=Salinarimonas sp. NSM TaxID=3458003 RepID=UPI00403757E1
MRTLSRFARPLRTTIAVVALYGLVLASLLSGLSGALAFSASGAGAGQTVWCPVDGSMPADAPADACWHACRLGSGPTGPAIAPSSASALPARVAAPVSRAAAHVEAPRPRAATAPLGARAPPVS